MYVCMDVGEYIGVLYVCVWCVGVCRGVYVEVLYVCAWVCM